MKSAAKALGLFALFAAVLAHAQPVPFKHVIIAVQENRTPDNLFAGVPPQNGWQGSPWFEAGVDLAKAPGALSPGASAPVLTRIMETEPGRTSSRAECRPKGRIQAAADRPAL